MFFVVFVFVLMIMFVFHALDHFFFLDAVTKHIEKVDHDHIFICCLLQDIIDPIIRLTTDVHEHVTCRDLEYIVCCRLIRVKIYTIIQKHRNIRIVLFVSEDRHDPVILREDRRHDR